MRLDEFNEIVAEIGGRIRLENRLPDWVFASRTGSLAFCQYSQVIEGSFEPVLAALALAHGDDYISVLQLDPAPSSYCEWYGCYPAMRLRAVDVDRTYWRAMSFEPQGDIAGAPINIANIVALAGSSGRWAVWGERRWDLGILLTDIPKGPWLNSGVPFVSPEEALQDFTDIGSTRSPIEFNRDAFVETYFGHSFSTSGE